MIRTRVLTLATGVLVSGCVRYGAVVAQIREPGARPVDPRVARVLFDVTTVVTAKTTPERAALIATRLRQIGIDRVLYGSDAAFGGNVPPREEWGLFRQIPLTDPGIRHHCAQHRAVPAGDGRRTARRSR